MKRISFRLLLVLGLCCNFGCEPEERFAWSPNGNRAAVIIENGLHFVDDTGALLTSLGGDGKEEQSGEIQDLEWLPDGSGVVVHRVRIEVDWQTLREALPEEEVDEVEALAAEMPRRVESAAIFLGPEAELGDVISRLSPEGRGADLSAFQLAWSRDREAIKVALKDAPAARAALVEIDEEPPGFPVHEISVVSLAPEHFGFAERRTVLRSLRGIQEMALAPDGSSVALGWQTDDSDRVDLEVVGLADGARVSVEKGIAPAFAWSGDLEGLVYLEPLAEKGGHLMRLMQQATKPEDSAEPRHLATVLIPFSPRLSVLPDGSILFAGQPVVLPASGRDSTPHPRLFQLLPESGEIREVPSEPGALPMDLGAFVPSPDGSRVAIVESGSDAVAIVNLESGKSELVADSHPGWKCRTLPAWKDSETLSYAILAENGKRIDWVLRGADGRTRRLSAAWPEDATSGWLELDRREGSDGAVNAVP